MLQRRRFNSDDGNSNSNSFSLSSEPSEPVLEEAYSLVEHRRRNLLLNIAFVGPRDTPYPNESFLVNSERSLDNCLSNSEDMLLVLAFEDGPGWCRSSSLVEDEGTLIQSKADPGSSYITCDKNSGSMFNRSKLKKQHFQENTRKSELSQKNTVGEAHCLKGFTMMTTSDAEPDSIAFLKECGVQESNSDDLIFGLLNIQNLRGSALKDHMILFIFIGSYAFYLDPQLCDGKQRNVIFTSISALSHYHYSLGRHHYFDETLQSLTFWPVSPRYTIRNYALRRITSSPPATNIKELFPNSSIAEQSNTIWPYNMGRRNTDRWIEFRRQHFPNSDIETWLNSDSAEVEVEDSVLRVEVEVATNRDLLLSFLYDEQRLGEHVLINDLREQLTKFRAMESWDRDAITVVVFIVQRSFLEHPFVGSDKNSYDKAHKSAEMRAHASQKTDTNTKEFRRRLETLHSKYMLAAKAKNITVARFCGNVIQSTRENVTVVEMRGIKYLVFEGKDVPKLIKRELMMIDSNSAGYDIRFHSDEDVMENFEWGGYLVNDVQGSMPEYCLTDGDGFVLGGLVKRVSIMLS